MRLIVLLLLGFIAGFGARAVAERPAPRAQVLVQDAPLAGFQFHAGRRLWPELRVGDALVLVREPDNPHDPLAVRVDWRGHKLGYVPRRENADIARFLDRGVPLEARISRLAEVRDPWQRIRFEVWMPLAVPASPGRDAAPGGASR